MKIQNCIHSLTAFAAVAFAASCEAALIVNGSFEEPEVPTETFATYGNTSTTITGWVVVGFDASIVSGPWSTPPNTYQAHY